MRPRGTPIGLQLARASKNVGRAFNDALAFLKQAGRVVLLIAGQPDPEAGGESEPRADGMVAHLKRHGVQAETLRVKPGEGESDIGRLLLGEAKALDADMIVMGAFHHSRVRQFILGGVTLTMLEQATIPLFMAH